MNGIGQPERATQKRVIALFRDELGYRFLCDWTDRPGNSNIEDGLLSDNLTKRGYTPAHISRTLDRLRTEANNDFAIAEEDTLRGKLDRRPDLVLYLNGIAIGVLRRRGHRPDRARARRGAQAARDHSQHKR